MKKLITIALAAVMAAALTVPALAVDYVFVTEDTTSYYKSTDYTEIFAVQYNYGGVNVIDFENRVELPGLYIPEVGYMPDDGVVYGLQDYGAEYVSPTVPTPNFTFTTTAFTPVHDVKRNDGSIGTLEIPSLKISMKAHDGTDFDSMAKGVGHFTESSGWDGNIALAGHNRGSNYAIGAIKDLKLGDTIKYTTTLGTRNYAVSFVGTISSTDWSYISATSDNRITLVTCLANQPDVRVVVQATAVK